MPRDDDANDAGVLMRPGTMDEFVFQEMARDVYRALDYVRAGDVVLDVGANVGAFACHLLAHVPDVRVICVEPIPSNLEVLRKNVGARATVEPCALSGSAGRVTMYDFGEAASACHSVYDVGAAEARPVRVHAETLESLLAKHGLQGARFLKMDCQGAEFDILPSTPHEVLARIDCIAMEVHPSIWGPKGRIGNIPGAMSRMSRVYRHLMTTHVPLHGRLYRGDVEVWLNRQAVPEATRARLQRKYFVAGLQRPVLYLLRGAKRFAEQILAYVKKGRHDARARRAA